MAGINLGTAYVQIMPSAKGIKGSITNALGNEPSSAGSEAGNNFAQQFVQIAKKIIVGAGIVKFVKDSMAEAGALQQTYMGGLDTIYGAAADSARNYAKEAAKAGISMNDYAEQAIGFGASLRQAFSGDTAKAVEAANTAILDMTDNAAKMGTPLENIKNAYQGFAKQNYTMLDNLKLGYGGTKKEMERLLADASKLSGVKYDISNLGDVYEAIHVIQGELGLTGVAAAEAEETFTGSMLAMKASVKNLMGNLALGNDITEDLKIITVSIRTFVQNNALPLLTSIFKNIPTLLKTAIPEVGSFIVEMLGQISSNAKEIEATAINIVRALVLGIINAAPAIVEAGVELIKTFGKVLSETHWEQLASELITNLSSALKSIATSIFGDDDIGRILFESISQKLPERIGIAAEIIQNIAEWITEAIPGLLTAAQSILQGLVDGIIQALQDGTLLEAVLGIIDTITTYAMQNGAQLLTAGAEMLTSLINGLVEALPHLIDFVIQMGVQFVQAIVDNFPALWEAGKNAVLKIGQGVLSLIGHVPDLLLQIGKGALDIFLTVDWVGLGKTVVDWIWGGISSLASKIWDKLKEIGTNALNNFKNINWYQLGYDVVTFILNGIKTLIVDVPKALLNAGKDAVNSLKEGVSKIPEVLKNIANTAISAVKGINWSGLGSAIINGIVNGLKSMGSAIKNTLLNFAKGALDAAKSFLGIKSPSRVFRDQVGKQIALGMAEGIEDNMSAVTDAMDDMAAETVLAMNPTIDAALTTPAAGGEIVNNITINAAPGMDEESLADMVIKRITFTMAQSAAAWG